MHVLALDQGTTSSRSIVFDATGSPVGVAQQEFTQHFPQNGWVEHDAEEIWATQAATMTGALARAGLHASDIAAVGITNQRETTVVWDVSTGKPIAPAIVWQDRRTHDFCETLRADGAEAMVQRKTGLLLDPYFSATKIRWILDHVAGARAKADAGSLRFGTIDSWLAWKLTKGERHVTDPSNASRTLLYDLDTGTWSDELLDLFGVPRSMLPEIVPSSGVIAPITASVAPANAPLAALIGDQQAALAGQGCFDEGDAKCTYGTGCFLLMNTGAAPRHSTQRLLTTAAWALVDGARSFALEGSVFIGGALVQWLRDGLGIIGSSSEIEALARSVPDSLGVVVVPAFAGLGAPIWDPSARGLIHGLTRGTTKAHIARAALEAIAFEVADLVDALEKDAGTRLDELKVDGGAAADGLLMETQADILGRPVVRPKVLETTALGAAHLAGLATKVWPSVDAIRAHIAIDRRFEPKAKAADIAERRARWRKAVERAREWA